MIVTFFCTTVGWRVQKGCNLLLHETTKLVIEISGQLPGYPPLVAGLGMCMSDRDIEGRKFKLQLRRMIMDNEQAS